ncbi:hypothetical protein EYZ11_000321 [Aspergillus tanneri]|nr:hypothetical protein EYZ11_000321 [Aspergillus tanneri]
MQLAHLFILLVLNSLTVFVLLILLVRTLYSLGSNTTTIESWEIERHETLVRRARHFGGYLEGPGGTSVRIRKQEFPYDIGIWANIKAGMGDSGNVISWFWPLARTPDRTTGLQYEVNDFEEPDVSWPPPDPDRIPIRSGRYRPNEIPIGSGSFGRDEIEAFKRRKAEDLKRPRFNSGIQRRKRFHNRFGKDLNDVDPFHQIERAGDDDHDDGEEAWKNADGERLRDFGVDEDIEFYDEEDIPLGILLRQRAQRHH